MLGTSHLLQRLGAGGGGGGTTKGEEDTLNFTPTKRKVQKQNAEGGTTVLMQFYNGSFKFNVTVGERDATSFTLS